MQNVEYKEVVGRGKRSPFLDIYRIALCIGVVTYHYMPIRPCSGPFMVNGFFVMSGFLLGVEYLRKKMEIAEFYGRKLQRLFPLFFIALLLGVAFRLLSTHKLPEHFSWGNFDISQFVMFYNTPLWYMVVEFVLLLFSPFLVYLLHKKNGIEYATVVMMVFTCFMFSKVGYCSKFAEGLYFSPLARCWQFMLGLTAADICCRFNFHNFCSETKGKIIFMCLSFVFIISSLFVLVVKQNSSLIHYWNYTFAFTFISSVFMAVLIPFLYGCKIKMSEKLQSTLTYVALLTYPVYLFHVIVYQYIVVGFERLFNIKDLMIILPLSITFTILISVVLLHCEKHYLRLWFHAK